MTPAPTVLFLPALVVLSFTVPAVAQDNPAPHDVAIVAEGDGSGNSGRIAVNIAAGSRNQQIGSAVIAVGELPIGTQSTGQLIDTPAMTDRQTLVSVGPGAFSNNSGLLSLNVAAGNQNQSANLALLAVGTAGVVSDQMLAQSSAPTNPAGSSARGLEASNDTVTIGDGAFSGNSGLVQINLVGGERNSSANTFALNVSAGGNP